MLEHHPHAGVWRCVLSMDLFKKVPPPTCGAFSKDFLSKEEKKDGTAYGINQGRKQEPLC